MWKNQLNIQLIWNSILIQEDNEFDKIIIRGNGDNYEFWEHSGNLELNADYPDVMNSLENQVTCVPKEHVWFLWKHIVISEANPEHMYELKLIRLK